MLFVKYLLITGGFGLVCLMNKAQHPIAEMLQPDLAAVWQERDQHRNAATIGAVDVWPKFSQQKAFLRAGLQPHTENDERTA